MYNHKLDKNFKAIMEATMEVYMEAGQEAGKLELVKTPLDKARAHADEAFKKAGKDLATEIPNFDKNFSYAQKQAGIGRTQRKDMPVIDNQDVKAFQARIKNGNIDVSKPFGDVTKANDPFPEGLKGKQAKDWLEGGLTKHDGEKNDDKVKVDATKEEVGKLKPIQKQIYFDKAMADTSKFGAKGSTDFLTGPNNNFIISADNYIIDGHHRYLAGILIDPKMKVPVVKIDMPIKDLLPMTLAYGDAIGNKRNA